MNDRPKISRQRELEVEATFLARRLAIMGARLVVLYGAVARGRADAPTKLRLLAVAESDLPFCERQKYFRERLKAREPVKLLVFTPAEFERAREENAYVRLALQYGRVVYAPERG